MTMSEALAVIHSPAWQPKPGFYSYGYKIGVARP